MTRKQNVFNLAIEKENRMRLKQNAVLELSPLECIKKEYFELIVKTLLCALKCKDNYTWGHSLRVAYLCVSVGREMGLSEADIYELEVSALFHDIGKIGVPDSVLLKASRLTDDEFLEMKLHPLKSFEILQDFPIFNKMAINAKFHHERFDGRGYPDGMKGEDIPLFSRIILIADTFDAMTSTRPYRQGLPFEVAFAELLEFSGTQFDPHIVKKFISSMTREQNKKEDTFKLQVLDGSFKKDAA